MKALVLSGGNTKGGYQAGHLKKFEEKGVEFDAVYGVSVGAVNTLGWGFGDAEKLCKVWLSLKSKKDLIEREPWYKLIFKHGFLAYNMNPLSKILAEYIDNPIKMPRCKLVTTYVDLSNGELKHAETTSRLHNPEFPYYVIASASEPPMVIPLGGKFFDGGLRDQTPLKKAIKDGANEIWVILNNNPHAHMDAWESKWPKSYSAISRTVDIIANEIFINDIHRCLAYNHLPDKHKIKLKYSYPREPLGGGGFEVSPGDIQRAINLGYLDADYFFET